jgi:hypothetical protein
MKPNTPDTKQRRQERAKAVLPVRVRGKDITGEPFEQLAHTLDVTPSGVRLGSVRHQLQTLDPVTIFYRQRKMEFRVIWTKRMSGTAEYQVGLQATTHDRDAWWLNLTDFKVRETLQCASPAAVTQSSGTAYEGTAV